MKKYFALFLFLLSFSFADCTFKGQDFMIIIEHHCKTFTCENVKGHFLSNTKFSLQGKSKGNSLNNIEFHFKRAMGSFIIRQNELFVIDYGKLVKSTKLQSCNANSPFSLKNILKGKERF